MPDVGYDAVRNSSRPCPCCAGLDEAPWPTLCDPCLSAWINKDWNHACDRPLERRADDHDGEGGV